MINTAFEYNYPDQKKSRTPWKASGQASAFRAHAATFVLPRQTRKNPFLVFVILVYDMQIILRHKFEKYKQLRALTPRMNFTQGLRARRDAY